MLLGIVASAGAARAEPCGHASRPWVSVAFVDGPWPERFESAVLGDLAAGLRRRDIDACPDGGGPGQTPLAAVRLARRAGAGVVVVVEVHDLKTEKRVTRHVDLHNVPPDGRSFAVALATDELVGASWAELGLKRDAPVAPEKSTPPPVSVGVEDEPPAAPPPSGSVRLGVRVAAERFLGGQTHLGGDAVLLVPFAARFQLDVAAGYRHGLDVEAPHGSVIANAAALGANVRYLLIRARPVELGFVLGARGAWVRFEGRAAQNERAESLDGFVLYGRSGLASAFEVGAGTWLELGAMTGLPLRALEATDTGQVVAGVSGVEFAGYLAFSGEL